MEKARIEFYRQRSFSEKCNATFDFIRENYKPLLKYSFYLIMPVCLIQAYTINSVTDFSQFITSSDIRVNWVLNYFITVICAIIGSAIISGFVYAMMQIYATREKRLNDIEYGDLSRQVAVNIKKCLTVSGAIILITLFAFGIFLVLTFISAWSLLFTVPGIILFILCLIPLTMLVPVYVFERDIQLVDAVRKAWKLGMATLGGMLGIIIVLSMLSSMISGILMIPWYIAKMVDTILSATAGTDAYTFNQSPVYQFALYILGLIQTYGSYVSTIITAVGLAFHYFHAREKIEGVMIETSISNFQDL